MRHETPNLRRAARLAQKADFGLMVVHRGYLELCSWIIDVCLHVVNDRNLRFGRVSVWAETSDTKNRLIVLTEVDIFLQNMIFMCEKVGNSQISP